MQVRSLGFFTDLFVCKAGGSSVVDAGSHIVVRTPDNPSFWWGNFVLVNGPQEVERGLAVFQREFPTAAHVAIGVDGSDGAVPPAAEALGFDADVSVVLTAQSLLPPEPLEAEIRVLSSDDDWEDYLRLRHDESGSTEDAGFERARAAEARRIADAGRGAFLGALSDGRLVASLGIVSDGSGTARYQNVLTHRDYRRQGLASQLVVAAAAIAERRWSVDRLVIVADSDGPAIALYRSLGFQDTEFQVQLARRPAGD